MSEKIKYTIKELKQPDKFRQFIGELVEIASANFNKILYAIGAVFVVLIIIYIVSSQQEKKEQIAGTMFESALSDFNQGNTDMALQGFSELIDEHPSQQSAKLARYYTGAINYDLGQYEKTIEDLQGFLNSSPDNKLLEDSANFTIGLAYYNLEKWQESADYLSKLQNSGSPYEKQKIKEEKHALERNNQYRCTNSCKCSWRTVSRSCY